MGVLSSKKFEKAMAQAHSYEAWLEAATDYDKAAGDYRWRLMDQSRRYDYVSRVFLFERQYSSGKALLCISRSLVGRIFNTIIYY